MYWRNLAPKSAQEDAPAASEQEMSKTRYFFIAQTNPIVSFFTSQIVCATRADGLAIIKEPTPAGIWSSKKLTIEQPLATVKSFTHTLHVDSITTAISP